MLYLDFIDFVIVTLAKPAQATTRLLLKDMDEVLTSHVPDLLRETSRLVLSTCGPFRRVPCPRGELPLR